MSFLILTVGLPRSGKSTWASKHKSEATIINPDTFRLVLTGQRWYAPIEPIMWGIVNTTIDALMMSGQNVILDATNLMEDKRQEWERNYRDNLYYAVFPTPKEVCIERAKAGEMEDLVPVIERMSIIQENEPIYSKDKKLVVVHSLGEEVWNRHVLNNSCGSLREALSILEGRRDRKV